MLALALYEEKDGIPEEVIILKEGNYDDEDYKKAVLKSKEIASGGQWSVPDADFLKSPILDA